MIGNLETIITKILIPGLATEASKEPIETKRERENQSPSKWEKPEKKEALG